VRSRIWRARIMELCMEAADNKSLGNREFCDLPDSKRADFKAVVGPLIREQFDVALRNDLPCDGLTGVRGWKWVNLILAGQN